jgi:hypothetical protein
MRCWPGHECCTFKNDTDNPSLFLGSRAVIDTLHDFRLCIAGDLRWDGCHGFNKEDMAKCCSPFGDVPGELVESGVEFINGEASFNNRRTLRNHFIKHRRKVARRFLK